MKSYTQGRNLYGKLTKDSGSANLSLGDEVANDKYRHLCALKDWPFLERVRTLTTTANTQAMNLPYDCDQVREISVVPLGQTTRFVPKLSPSDAHWDRLNLSTFTSDSTEWYIVREGQLLLWPTPVQTGNTVYVAQKCRVIDLSIADLTSPTVTSIANGGTAMVVSAGLTAQMVGRWVRITYSDTANKGDGLWYEIAGIGSATTLTLTRAYGGVSITAGAAACTIGQMPLLPESFQNTPWIGAVADYWQKESGNRAVAYLNQYAREEKDLINSWSAPTGSMVIDDGFDQQIINPNLTIMR